MKEVDFQSTRKEGRGIGSGVIKCSHPCGTQKIGGGLPHNFCSRRHKEADSPADAAIRLVTSSAAKAGRWKGPRGSKGPPPHVGGYTVQGLKARKRVSENSHPVRSRPGTAGHCRATCQIFPFQNFSPTISPTSNRICRTPGRLSVASGAASCDNSNSAIALCNCLFI